MKIFYDYQIFESQIYGGISRYFFELIKGIESFDGDIEYTLPIENSSNYYLTKIPAINSEIKKGSDYYNQFLSGIEFPGKWKAYQIRNKLFSKINKQNQNINIANLKTGNFDLFHPTEINDYFLDYLGKKPFVITIHDLIDEYFPEYSFHVHSDYKTSIKEKLIERATGVIAISESTKKDIVARFNTDPTKIKVIYHGVSEFETNENNTRIVPEQYFLFVGKRTHYKNFYFFIQCIESFLIKDPTLKIVCVGAKFNNLELQYFKDLKVLENIRYINADDSMLGNLYRHAVAFVYPSLYEGFGMPILEAFKNSCPVLLSNTSSLPEIAGDAALYFNPKDVDSVKASIYKILNDESVRNNLIEKGIERVKKFSWNATVEQTLQFYKALT